MNLYRLIAVPIIYLVLSCSSETFAQPFNQIIGTQAIPILYGCGSKCSVTEAAANILELGSRIIKIKTTDPLTLKAVLDMPFHTYFFWWRSDGSTWINGFSEEARAKEYFETYHFAKQLLIQFKESEKTFFLGNWEGDWYLLQRKDGCTIEPCTLEPTQINADNMATWLNTRQQAVDDARRDYPSKSKIYLYAEVNRVLDATRDKKIRMVNAVLPQTNVDYVSYSAYDVQNESQEIIKQTLDFIESRLKPKAGITGRRVFIGEMAMQARAFNDNPEMHEFKNREIMLKFLRCKVPYILYWQILNNEIHDGKQEGFWLIDNQDHKWPLWYTLFGLFNYQNEVAANGKNSYDFIWEKSIEYLEKYQSS
ncbi:MAG: hypothetical protein H0U57_09045 [Tatlockia sp.]|nr:hypothetical protein [Tatlockia sp.]